MSPAAPALPRKKLPVGIQTLAKLRDEDRYYVVLLRPPSARPLRPTS